MVTELIKFEAIAQWRAVFDDIEYVGTDSIETDEPGAAFDLIRAKVANRFATVGKYLFSNEIELIDFSFVGSNQN
jgi:hypothetical protein